MTMTVLLWAASLAAPAVVDAHPVTRFESVSQPASGEPGAMSDQVGITSDAYERMTVPVRLAGSGPFRFLVDTGSDRTAISRELAGKLRLAEGRTATMHSATGRSEVRMALLPELTVSRKAVRHIRAPLLDAADIGADGILGIDSLRSHRVLFDFAGQSLSIASAESPITEAEKDAIVVRARRREGRLVITDARAEDLPVSVVLDTGSQYSVGNAALRRKLERRGAISAIRPVELVSVTGELLRGELAIVRRVEIGGAVLEGLVLVFADAHTFAQLGLGNRPALLLGMNTLRSFDQVSIDFGARKLRLVLPKAGARKPSARS